MGFDSVADQLYGQRREDFIGARDEAVREARSRGDRTLAARIQGLRKPTVGAWLVNQVAREDPRGVDDLLRLGRELRRAHENLDGAELRTLSRQRHEVVGRLTDRARALGRSAGYSVGSQAEQEVMGTFEAAVADEEAARTVASGRLSAALSPGTSDAWLNVAPAQTAKRPSAPPRTPPKDSAPPKKAGAPKEAAGRKQADERKEAAAREEAATRKRDELRRAKKKVADMAAARSKARRTLADAERKAVKAAEEVAGLRERLAVAERSEKDLRETEMEARKKFEIADRGARDAERDLAELE